MTLNIDEKSLLVSTETELSLDELELELSQAGYTLNYFAPPHNQFTLTEALVQRLPNLYHDAFGGIEDLCSQVKVITKEGKVYSNILTPRSAAGPGFKKLVIGAQHRIGTPIQATLRIFHKPNLRQCFLFSFSSTKRLQTFLRQVNKLGLRPPLKAIVPFSALKEMLSPEEEVAHLLLMAFWGDGTLILGIRDALKILREANEGRYVNLQEEGLRDQVEKVLFYHAIKEWHGENRVLADKIKAHHQYLTQRVKRAL